MIDNLISVSVTVFVLMFSAYILIVLKEKVYLNNNVIFLDHKDLDEKHIKNLDIKHFMLGSTEVMAGDEVKIMLEDDKKLVGIIIGANKSNNTITIAISGSDVTNLSIKSIKKLKVISRYGKFFTKF